MRLQLLTSSLLSLAVLAPAFLIQDEPVVVPSKPKVAGFSEIGFIKVQAKHEVEGKFASDAPSLSEYERDGRRRLAEIDLDGNLPARLEILTNTFKSSVTGDVVYSLRLQLYRPVTVLGTVESLDAVVWSHGVVGRCRPSEAKRDLIESLDAAYTTLKQHLKQ